MDNFYLEELTNCQRELEQLLERSSFREKRVKVRVVAPDSVRVSCLDGDEAWESTDFISHYRFILADRQCLLEVEFEAKSELTMVEIKENLSVFFNAIRKKIKQQFSNMDNDVKIIFENKKINVSDFDGFIASRRRNGSLYFLLPFIEEFSAKGVLFDFSRVEIGQINYQAWRCGEVFKFISFDEYQLEVGKEQKIKRLRSVESEVAVQWIHHRIKKTRTLDELKHNFSLDNLLSFSLFFNSPSFKEIEAKVFKKSTAQMLELVKAWQQTEINKMKALESSQDKKMIWRSEKLIAFQLLSISSLECEGLMMRNCLRSPDPDLLIGNSHFFSFRDNRGQSHVTLEWDYSEQQVVQIKGVANSKISEKYQSEVAKFILEYLRGRTSGQLSLEQALSLSLSSHSIFPSDLEFSIYLNSIEASFVRGIKLLAPWGWTQAMMDSYFSSLALGDRERDWVVKFKKDILNRFFLCHGVYTPSEVKNKFHSVQRVLKINQGLLKEMGINLSLINWLQTHRYSLSKEEFDTVIGQFLDTVALHQAGLERIKKGRRSKSHRYFNLLSKIERVVFSELKRTQRLRKELNSQNE